LAKSQTIIFQETSFHKAKGNSIFVDLKSLDSITSFNQTVCLLSFGTSIQTTQRPGIGA